MNMGNNSQKQLQSIIDRIENIDGEIAELRDNQKEILQEAKSNGYDLPALRAVIARRKAIRKDANRQITKEQIVEIYLHALGDLADLPLGQSAIERATA